MAGPNIDIPVEMKDGKVILEQKDFQKLVARISDRKVTLTTNLRLAPKNKPGRKPKAKPAAAK